MDFPYYRKIWTYDKERVGVLVNKLNYDIKKKMPDSLKNKKIYKYESEYLIIKDIWSNNVEINQITDYFSENERIKCNFKGYKSPLEYWNKNNEKLMKTNNGVYELREILYNETKFCNNFRITVAMAVLSIFKPKSWLDISAGWGDRLIAGILYGVEYYCGVDPNPGLHKCYNEIINTMVSDEEKKDNYVMIEDGFETAVIPEKEYDIVFSSPPFYDLEKYSDSEKDSINRYKSEKEWCDLFLMTSIFKAISYLKPGGYLVLYIYSYSYLNKRLKELEGLMENKGWMYFYDLNNNPRGMQVWKKK
jgi:hypothetical protein